MKGKAAVNTRGGGNYPLQPTIKPLGLADRLAEEYSEPFLHQLRVLRQLPNQEILN